MWINLTREEAQTAELGFTLRGEPETAAKFREVLTDAEEPNVSRWRKLAQEFYPADDDAIQVSDDAVVSLPDEGADGGGCWVMAWVWMADSDMEKFTEENDNDDA
jgi:hypothetical protein